LLRLLKLLNAMAEALAEPPEEVDDRFWRRNDIQRRRQRCTLLEVLDPEFAPREFPLDVGLVLEILEIFSNL